MPQISFRIHIVQLAAPVQAIQQRTVLSPQVGAEEQVVLAAEADHPQRIFRQIVIRFCQPVIAVVRQRRPLVQHVVERFRRF